MGSPERNENGGLKERALNVGRYTGIGIALIGLGIGDGSSVVFGLGILAIEESIRHLESDKSQ